MAADKLDSLRPAEFGGSGGGDGTGYVPLRRRSAPGEGTAQENTDTDGGHSAGATAVSVAGIPAEQLTPAVDKAIEALMAAIERLRHEAGRLRVRVGDLEQRVSHHDVLPVLSRTAFTAQLTHVLGHVGQLPMSPSLVVMSVVNAETVRLRHGIAARDGLLAWLAGEIKKSLYATDTLGSLGGCDFGIIALTAGDQVATDRAEPLRRAIADESFRWRDAALAVDIACGAAVLETGMTAATALARADEDLCRARAAADAMRADGKRDRRSGDDVG